MIEYSDGLILIGINNAMNQLHTLQNEYSTVTIDYDGDTLEVLGDKRNAAILILQYALKTDSNVIQYSFNNFTFKFKGTTITVETRWPNPNDLVLEMVDNLKKILRLKAFL